MARSHRTRRKPRIVDFYDEIAICGVKLRRLTLPNGKRVFEEEGVKALLLDAPEKPTMDDFKRFEVFSQQPVSH